MATTKNSQSIYDLKTYAQKEHVFTLYFASGTNSVGSFSQKLELLTLIAYLYQQMKKKDSIKYKNVKDLMKVLYPEYDPDYEGGLFGYLTGLCIIVEDLLFNVDEEIAKPGNYTNAKQIVERIKTLIDQWLPF